jgi:hypothetical protein
MVTYLTHRFLTEAETKLADTHFDSIADRALTEASGILLAKRWATITLASLVAEIHPNASSWPFITVPGYQRIVNNLLNTTSSQDMAVSVVVRPEQLAPWENFIYEYYEEQHFPNTTAVSPFGRDVWVLNATTGERYHDTGELQYPSPNKILTPIVHVDEGAEPVLLFNLHSESP